MEIIGDNKRLVGCNIKIVNYQQTYHTAYLRLNEIVKVEGDDGILWYIGGNEFVSKSCTKIILDNTFLQKFKSEKIAINCESEEEAKSLLKWLGDNDICWSVGGKVTPENNQYEKDEGKGIFYHYNPLISLAHNNLCWPPDFLYPGHYEDYTIIKFKDTIIESFNETPGFQEFVEYWKKGSVAVKCSKAEEKLHFPNMGSDSMNFPFVYWCTEHDNSYHWDSNIPCKYYSEIIRFEDLKNWKEILINKEREAMKEKTYKINVPISIKSIMEAKPCNSNSEVDIFIQELLKKHPYNYEITTWEEFKEYPILMQYKEWFLGDNRTGTKFIEEAEAEFEPFEISFKIDSKEDLLNLWHRMNCCDDHIKRGSSLTYEFKLSENALNWFSKVSEEMWRVNK